MLPKLSDEQLRHVLDNSALPGEAAIALEEFQQRRNRRMGAMAGQQTPPPLSDTIPQQAMNPRAAMRDPGDMGIPAALPDIPPSQPMSAPPPQQLGAQVPPQQQRPLGMASGGIVAFRQGGMRRFGSGDIVEAPSWRANWSELWNKISPPESEGSALYREQMGGTLPRAPIQQQQIQPVAPTGIANAGFGTTRPDYINPSMGAQPAMGGYVPPPPTPRAGIASVPRVTPQLPIDVGAAALQAQKYRDQATSLAGGIKDIGSPEKTRAAVGDMHADVGTELEQQKALAGTNPLAPFQDKLAELQATDKAATGDNKYKALLQMGLGMMGTKVQTRGIAGLLQASGEEGGKALTDYEKMVQLQKDRELKIMGMQTSLAAAEDARNRGMIDQAQNMARHAQTTRIEMFKNDQALALAGADAGVKVALANAKGPMDEVDAKAKVMTAIASVKHADAVMVSAQAHKTTSEKENPQVELARIIAKGLNKPMEYILSQIVLGDPEKDLQKAVATALVNTVKKDQDENPALLSDPNYASRVKQISDTVSNALRASKASGTFTQVAPGKYEYVVPQMFH